MAELEPGTWLGATVMADKIGTGGNYLGKILQDFAKQGLLISQKGLNGGFRLARPAAVITLFEVVDHIDQLSRWTTCFLGNPVCNSENPCAMHFRWLEVREFYMRVLQETTITDVAHGALLPTI